MSSRPPDSRTYGTVTRVIYSRHPEKTLYNDSDALGFL